MCNAVDCLIQNFGGHVVEQEHRHIALREIMLQCQDLTAITQRALRKKAYLRQTIEYDAAG